jgi:uncharacterized membrane protein
MRKYIGLYLATLAVFLALDMVWLGLVAQPFYQSQLGYLISPSPNLLAAGIFYLLFIAGILVFVILPGLKESSTAKILLRAGFFGLVTYATYDLTNLATIKDWPIVITLVDLAWGMILSMAVGAMAWGIGRRIFRNSK